MLSLIEHENPPGLMEVSYRASTYATALQRLRIHLALHRSEYPGLRMLALYGDENWAVALLEACAILADILSFYQERIANEGYLRTATELRSVQGLVSAIGYEPRPGVAANSYLAFTVRQSPSNPFRRTTIPAGTVVQSIPSQVQPLGLPTDAPSVQAAIQLPQTFETGADFEARTEWNALKPSTISFKTDDIIKSDLTTLRLVGTNMNLRQGDVMLIVGENALAPGTRDQQPVWICVTLTDIQTNRSRGYTQVTWQSPEERGVDDVLLRNPEVFVMRQKAALYGFQRGGVYYSPLDTACWTPSSTGLPPSPVYTLVQHKTGGLLAGTDSGIYRSLNNGESWETSKSGLLNSRIASLTVSSDGRVYAGSTAGCVFCSADGGSNWKQLVSKPVKRTTLLGLAIPGKPITSVSLPKGVIRKIASFTHDRTTYLTVAMDDGVYISSDQGGSWRQIHPGRPIAQEKTDGSAWSFVTARQKARTFVGMDSGVFPIEPSPLPPAWWSISFTCVTGFIVLLILAEILHLLGIDETLTGFFSGIGRTVTFIAGHTILLFAVLLAICAVLLCLLLWWTSKRWMEKRRPQPAGEIQALVVDQDGTMLAGTSKGIYRTNHDESWTEVKQGPIIQAFASTPKYLFAGSHDGGMFRSTDNGITWEDYTSPSPFTTIGGLVVHDGGIFACGSVDDNDSEDRWSRFQVQNKQLYLDKVYPALTTGTWVVVRQDDQMSLYKAASVTSVPTGDYKKRSKVTCLSVDRADNFTTFDRRRATLCLQSEPLILYNDAPVEGDAILLDNYVPDLATGHQVIVSGKRPRIRIFDSLSKNPVLIAADGFLQVPFDQYDTYILMSSPPPLTSSAPGWLLRNRDGFVGTLTTSQDIIVVYEPATDDDESISELATIRSIRQKATVQSVQEQEQTIISFQAALQNAYDRSTVTIYANIVYSTQGQTVTGELLSNGTSTKPNYYYTLKQKPLTYIPASTPEGIQSTLKVMVDQVLWRQVTTVQELATSRRSYLLRRDSQGNTTVYFGTDNQSPNLPAGTQQLTATYRIGIGESGNVDANSLTLLRTRPAGIQKVTNPMPASGGKDPDSMEQMRRLAPLQVRTMQRIISLNDYENFTCMFGGIDKVQAQRLWDGHRHLVHLTVAGAEGAAVANDSALYTGLLASISAASPSPAQLVYLDSFEALFFQLKARLLMNPDWSEPQDAIVTNATQQLSTAFGFKMRDLAQDVTAAEVITLLQHLPGVLAVELERLFIKGETPADIVHAVLEARPGRIEGDKILPAQMLQIDTLSIDGIILNVEVCV